MLLLFSSDEYGDDKTAFAYDDSADDQSNALSCDPSDIALDTVSVATASSTLLASGSDELLSRDTASSSNHVTASPLNVNSVRTRPDGISRRDLSFVCRADGDGSEPPRLPASGSTLQQNDGLSSLQHGASSLLNLVYHRPSNASQSFATADHVRDWTAVEYTARSTSSSSSTSFSPWSSPSAPLAAVQSFPEVNVENTNLCKTNRVPVMPENVVENHWNELSFNSVEQLSPSHHYSQLNSTANIVCDSTASSGGYTSSVLATNGVVDLQSDVSLLPGVDMQRLERPISPCDSVIKPPVNTSTAALHVEDYLLSDSEGTGRELTNVDVDEVRILGQNDIDNDVARDVATAAVSYVPETLGRVIEGSDASQTLDESSPISDGLTAELVATCEMVQTDEAVSETPTSLRCNGACQYVDHCSVCASGHLSSTTNDADDPCSCDVTPSCDAVCDVNSNMTSTTSAISTSGDDLELDEIESRDIEQCQRVAEQLSAAWSNTVRRAHVLDNNDDVADLVPPTLSTFTNQPIRVR